MKYYKFVLIVFLILTLNKANADDFIATQTFTTQINDTIGIEFTGHQSATIDGITGNLGSNLAVNFKITSNVAIGDLRLRAEVDNNASATESAFTSSGASIGNNLPVTLILANTNGVYKPTHESIINCKGGSCACTQNPESIAYSGTVNIDNNGLLNYIDNSGNGYFTANIGTNVTNLSLDLGTTVKPGTYNISTALDTLGTYQARIYIDNIPD